MNARDVARRAVDRAAHRWPRIDALRWALLRAGLVASPVFGLREVLGRHSTHAYRLRGTSLWFLYRHNSRDSDIFREIFQRSGAGARRARAQGAEAPRPRLRRERRVFHGLRCILLATGRGHRLRAGSG
jgi:hypothetical protein